MSEKLYGWKTVHVPESCKGVDIVIGVDEAGRGPVLGPLVYAAAFWPVSENAEIIKMGFDDSKQLKEGERDKLLAQLIGHPSIGWVIEEITAESVSEEMLRSTPISLNVLSYDAVIRALRTIVTPIGLENPPIVTDVFIDTVGDPDYYKSRLIAGLGADYGNFTIEKKADSKFKVVSAASIVAKVTRDTIIRNWQWKEAGITNDKSFGSGYPSDDVCVQWLLRSQQPLFGYPNLVRFSWGTTKELLSKGSSHSKNNSNNTKSSSGGSAVSVQWLCDEEENDTAGCANISSFFGTGNATKKQKRSHFFTKRKIQRLSRSSFQ